MFTEKQAVEAVIELEQARAAEADTLDLIHHYWRGSQPLPIAPIGVPEDVKRLARMSRVNVTQLVVNVLAQGIHASGFRDGDGISEDEAWAIWQANKWDAHQGAVYRTAFAYSTAYVTVLPGDPMPIMKGWSPRNLTALYGVNDEWPEIAMSVQRGRKNTKFYRLMDATHVYEFRRSPSMYLPGYPPSEGLQFEAVSEHGADVCPVVRFRGTEDLDDEALGEVLPIIPLQDQLDLTSFQLMVGQHFQSFRQRYAIGWTADSENQLLAASASKFMTFEDPDVKVGEFGQIDLRGYMENREGIATLMAVVSQTPPQHLLGKMVNISAEALAAAESGHRRKAKAMMLSLGESNEQALRLAARYQGVEVSDSAQIVWDDTEARSLSATIDAYGKAATMLEVPKRALWEKIPGVTQVDVQRWERMAEAGPGGIEAMLAELADQVQPAEGFEPVAP